jgi:hypothetical protein
LRDHNRLWSGIGQANDERLFLIGSKDRIMSPAW